MAANAGPAASASIPAAMNTGVHDGACFMAQAHCNGDLFKGNRKGWRLPTIQVLASLVDPSVAAPGPTLPAGHPFPTVERSGDWSATSRAGDNNSVWILNFNTGNALVFAKSTTLFFWCVRGGQGVDAQ